MNLNMYWPIALIVFSNVFYHICSKQTPGSVHPLASLTVTYLVGALASGILYYILNRGGNLLREYQNIDWTSFVLGIAVVGLETGCIYMYKVGWNINSGQLIYSALLAIALLFVGYFLYHEAITWTKVVGIVVCLIGLLLINQ